MIALKKKRLDGVRITGLDGFHAVAPYVMPKRTEAEVSSTETFDVTDLCAYLEKRNKEEGTKLKWADPDRRPQSGNDFYQ